MPVESWCRYVSSKMAKSAAIRECNDESVRYGQILFIDVPCEVRFTRRKSRLHTMV